MNGLILNLGGTSTKAAVFHDASFIRETIRHNPKEMEGCTQIWDQYSFRKNAILDFLKRHDIFLSSIDLIIVRGPSVKPVPSGVFEVNDAMVSDARSGKYGIHVCNLGCVLGKELADSISVHKKDGSRPKVLTADLPCVDEMIPIARYTGLPQITRHSFFQALSHKAVGREIANRLGKRYEELSLVITHLGSGISVASHVKGKVIDITNGIGGESPFGMDRIGTLPAADWMNLILSDHYSKAQLNEMLNVRGGLMAHLGTNDAKEVEKRIDSGDVLAEEVYQAMAFQVVKALGAASFACGERPDAIGITGGLANSKRFITYIKECISWICPVYVLPEVDEIDALYGAVKKALEGEVPIQQYE
jgi:butyrate kinase